MKAAQARVEWSRLLNQVARNETRVVVEEDGVPIAAVVSARDLAQLQQLEQQRERDLATLRASQDGFKDDEPDDVEREIAQALTDVRADRTATKRSAP